MRRPDARGEARHLKQLEGEAIRHEQLVADLTLHNVALKDIVSRKW